MGHFTTGMFVYGVIAFVKYLLTLDPNNSKFFDIWNRIVVAKMSVLDKCVPQSASQVIKCK